MKLLKNRPNIVFFLFIIVVFIAFTAAIIVFHTSVNESAKNEMSAAQELAQTQAKLNRTQQILFDIESELNKSKDDIETFDNLYTETNDELAKTETALESTSSKLKVSEDLVKKQITQINELINQKNDLTNQIASNNATIAELEDDIEDMIDDIDDICDAFSTDPEPEECDDY